MFYGSQKYYLQRFYGTIYRSDPVFGIDLGTIPYLVYIRFWDCSKLKCKWDECVVV